MTKSTMRDATATSLVVAMNLPITERYMLSGARRETGGDGEGEENVGGCYWTYVGTRQEGVSKASWYL